MLFLRDMMNKSSAAVLVNELGALWWKKENLQLDETVLTWTDSIVISRRAAQKGPKEIFQSHELMGYSIVAL